MSRFVSIKSVRLDLSGGDWVEVKHQLSYGDMQRVASLTRGDFTAAELHLVAEYLLEWSFTDEQGKAVPIGTDGEKLAALKALSTDAFREVNDAINAHAEALEKSKKPKAPRGLKRSSQTSASAA